MLYKKKLPLFVFLVPGLLLMVIFLFEPFIENIRNSFYDMGSIVRMPGQSFPFIGLKNFKELFHDAELRIALLNSFKMMGLVIVFQVGLGFVLAVLVSRIKKGQHIFRTVYFFPIVISGSAIGLLFTLFYNYYGGALNQILALLHKAPVYWLGPKSAFAMLSIPIIWSYVGFYFVIMLTGLSSIPDDIYEAAEIDGCSKFRQVFSITIPLLRGVICTCITLAVTGAIKVFDIPWMIAQGGAPNGTTHFLGTYMYETTFNMSNYDYGSTLAIFIVILGVIVSKVVTSILNPDDNL